MCRVEWIAKHTPPLLGGQRAKRLAIALPLLCAMWGTPGPAYGLPECRWLLLRVNDLSLHASADSLENALHLAVEARRCLAAVTM